MSVEVTIDDKGFKSLLAKMTASTKPGVAMKLVGNRLVKWINDNFESEGALGERGRWQDLSELTLARRRGGAGMILQDTGRLKRSFEMLESSDDFVKVGSIVQYAATHQYGRGNIPARPILPSASQTKVLASSILRAYIEQELSKR